MCWWVVDWSCFIDRVQLDFFRVNDAKRGDSNSISMIQLRNFGFTATVNQSICITICLIHFWWTFPHPFSLPHNKLSHSSAHARHTRTHNRIGQVGNFIIEHVAPREHQYPHTTNANIHIGSVKTRMPRISRLSHLCHALLDGRFFLMWRDKALHRSCVYLCVLEDVDATREVARNSEGAKNIYYANFNCANYIMISLKVDFETMYRYFFDLTFFTHIDLWYGRVIDFFSTSISNIYSLLWI